MTNQEAIEFLKNMIDRESIGFVCPKGDGDVAIWQYHVEALQMAISALQAQEHIIPQYGQHAKVGRPLGDAEIIPRLRDIQQQIGGSYAIDRAIELIEVLQTQEGQQGIEQIKWERDLAIQQLADLGYGLGEKPKETHGDAISRNALIHWLNKMDRYVSEELRLCGTDEKFPQNEVFIVDDVYEEVEQLSSIQPEPERKINKAISALEAQKWVPVSERLPKDVEIFEEYPTVIFSTKDAVYCGFYDYLGGNWWAAENL